MKKYTIITFLTILPSFLNAQNVWTEGTTWDIEFTQESNKPHTQFVLMSSLEIEGTSYYPLISSTAEGCDTIAYLRSERGDSLVYARVIWEGRLLQESLLYDFTKIYEYGGIMRFGTIYGTVTDYISNDENPITYLYDVIEEGDCIPMWKGVIYMIGHIEGPLGLFFGEDETDDMPKPKPTNVSHILFGTKKGALKVLYVQSEESFINKILTMGKTNFVYSLQGVKIYGVPKRGIYIINGRKFLR